jgi:hypothetical protein
MTATMIAIITSITAITMENPGATTDEGAAAQSYSWIVKRYRPFCNCTPRMTSFQLADSTGFAIRGKM